MSHTDYNKDCGCVSCMTIRSLRTRIEELEGQLCRARELYKEYRRSSVMEEGIEPFGETQKKLKEFEEALSSPSPCRHEEENVTLRRENGELLKRKNIAERIAGPDMVEYFDSMRKENATLREAVEWVEIIIRDDYATFDVELVLKELRRRAGMEGSND